MKSIAIFATFAAAAFGVSIATEAEAEAGAWSGPIVPESFSYAVHDFNMEAPFTDQECYQKQVDIYSDQIIAIEALRLEVLNLTQRVTQAEYDYESNALRISENAAKIHHNREEALYNAAKIDVLFMDVNDIADCLRRQWSEQEALRHVLELYCHQFTYTAYLPHQCEPILGAGTHMQCNYAWPY